MAARADDGGGRGAGGAGQGRDRFTLGFGMPDPLEGRWNHQNLRKLQISAAIVVGSAVAATRSARFDWAFSIAAEI
jgi:hypothetical protein